MRDQMGTALQVTSPIRYLGLRLRDQKEVLLTKSRVKYYSRLLILSSGSGLTHKVMAKSLSVGAKRRGLFLSI